LLKATGSTSIVRHACSKYAWILVVIATSACGSSSDRPATLEVSTAVDASVGGDGALETAEASIRPEASIIDNDSALPESEVTDAGSKASDASAPPDAEPIADARHVSSPSDGPVDAGAADAHDAGCAPGCPTGCRTLHDNGVGGTFTDCSPLSTYSLEQTTLAANSASNVAGDLMGGLMCGFGPNTSTSLCKVGPTNCACRTYAATGTFVTRIGHVTNNTVIANCLCATTLDPTWN
jgi:hypothetical protein